PIVTWVLLGLNILVFLTGMSLAMQRKIRMEDFILGNDRQVNMILDEMGSLSRMEVIAGEWWRLVSYFFLHAGVLHLVMNMYVLYALGPTMETMFGAWRYLILYLVSGLGGGVAVVLGDSGAVGASGALCGLLAGMGVWVLLNRPYLPAQGVSAFFRSLMINVMLIV